VSNKQQDVSLGDLVAAVFDEAREVGDDGAEVAGLAISTVERILHKAIVAARRIPDARAERGSIKSTLARSL
jgi:hypothetical protein